jgi:hypothetical protein
MARVQGIPSGTDQTNQYEKKMQRFYDISLGAGPVNRSMRTTVSINDADGILSYEMVCHHMEAYRMLRGMILQCPDYCQRDCVLLMEVGNEQTRRQERKEASNES